MAMNCSETGKVCHPSKGKANTHLKDLRTRRGYNGVSYLCKHCNLWHVGREKQNAHKNKYKRV